MAGKHVRVSRWVAALTVVMLMITIVAPVAIGEGWLRSIVATTKVPLTFIDAGDVDRDGVEEVYTASMRGQVYKVWASGDQFFHSEIPSAPDSIQAMLIGDIDDDSYDEIYVASKHTYDNGRIYRYTYSGSSWNQDVIYNSFGPSDHPMDLAIGDGNNNGVRELYYIEAGGGLNYLSLSGSSWFSVNIDSQYPGFYRCIAIGDGNDDGNNELYVGTDTNKILRFRYNFGSWSSSEVGEGSSDGYWDYVKDIEVGDPDEDGMNEVVAVIGDESLRAYEFQGTWQYDDIDELTQVFSLTSISFGDGDDDGRDELFAAATNNAVYYYYWNSDFSTWGRIEVSMGPMPNDVEDIVVTEVDGKPDFKEIYAPCEDGRVYRFSRDVDPPSPPIVWSPTHPEKVWKNITKAVMEWKMPDTDPSGIAGFSYHFFNGQLSPPDNEIDYAGTDYYLKSPDLWDGDEVYFAIKAMDGAGNWGRVAYYGPMYIDTAPPEDLDLIINGDEVYISTQYAILEVFARDDLSGMFNMSFSNDAGAHWADWVPYNTVYSNWDLNHHSPGGITDGPRHVHLRVQDTAGNVATGAADEIFLDQAPPTDLWIELNDGEKYTNKTIVGIEVSAEDPTGGSKLAYMSFSNDNKQWCGWKIFNTDLPYWDLTNDPGGWDGDGEHKVYFRTQDTAGNIGGPTSASIVLDREPPSRLELVINSGRLVAKNTSLTLSPRAEDVPDHSGVGEMAFREKGPWGDWEKWRSSTEFQVSKGDGTKFIQFKARDRAGNEAEPVTGFIVLDSKTPRISHVRVIGITDKNAVVTWTTDIPANGVVQYGTSINYNGEKHHSDLSTHHSVTLAGLRPANTYHFRVESADAAGQAPTISRDMTFVTKDYPDTMPPTITNVRVEGITDTRAVISWKTNEPADTRLKYGTTPQYGMVEGNSKDVLEHREVLGNLKANTRYYFSAVSTDPRGNGPSEATASFKTLDRPDNEPPTITNLKVIGITDSLAVVTWQTNEPALSIVEFGFTLGYGQVAVCEQYEKVHRTVLTGLQPDSTYHLIVRAIDASGNGPTTSDDHAFFTTTVKDEYNPVLTNVRAEAITSNTAVISWATDEPADSGVEYYSSSGIGESVYDLDMVETHSILLSDLEPDTDYHYRVISYDASGNGPAVSADFVFTTNNDADIDPPAIFQLRVEGITNTLAVVMWDTNEETTGMVEYGTESRNYTFEVEEEGLLREHSVVLWGLVPGTNYFLKVQATDSAGNGPAISNETIFKTLTNPDTSPPDLIDLTVTAVTHNTVTIVWRTDEPADSEVRFGDGVENDMVAKDGRFGFEHTMVLQNLKDNTTYSFTATSTDPSGNMGTSGKDSFKTEPLSINPPPPPPPPPNGPGTPSDLEETGPWLALGLIVILAIILTVYMFSKGVFGTGKRSRKKETAATTPGAAYTHAHATHPPVGMAYAHAQDDGICPHCQTHISLADASRLDNEDKRRKEAERQRKEEARQRREEAAAKHRRRLETIEKRVSILAPAKAAPVERTTLDHLQPEDEVEDPEGHTDDELEDLYDEVEEEEDTIEDPDTIETPEWTPPTSPVLADIKSERPEPVSSKPRKKKGKRTPLKTVKCGNCRERIPIYTKKRPVRITCPSCGKSGTLKGK